jgi:hypothetical protein
MTREEQQLKFNTRRFTMSHRIICTVIAVAFLFSFAFAQIEVWDDVDENTTWSDLWYRIMTDISVIDGATLTIDSGVLVDFVSEASITVTGGCELVAGALNEDVTIFTSSQATPTVGYWEALIADGNEQQDYAEIALTNCEIKYGGDEFQFPHEIADGPIQCKGYAKVTVENCYIHHNLGAGVDMDHDHPAYNPNLLSVKDSKIDSCEVGIVLEYPDDQIPEEFKTEVKRNYIDSSDYFGMYIHLLQDYVDIDIKNNIIARSDSHGVYIWERGGHFVNNVIDSAGDADNEYGIYIRDYREGDTDIRNNIIINTADYAILNDSEPVITVAYNCYDDYGLVDPVEDPWSSYVNSLYHVRDEDPRFVEGFGEDNYYHLLWDSPCLGEGDENLTNSNPAYSRSDIGAYGGPYADPYFVGITGGNVSGSLDQDASPYHVLADFTVGYGAEQTLALEAHDNDPDADCEFLFAENTGTTHLLSLPDTPRVSTRENPSNLHYVQNPTTIDTLHEIHAKASSTHPRLNK